MGKTGIKRIVRFAPAYDMRNADPLKNYGVHGVEIRFVLQGKEGALEFLLFTGWQLPNVAKEEQALPYFTRLTRSEPFPADLIAHSAKPLFEEDVATESCEYLHGDCFGANYGGLAAKPIFTALLEKGDKGVWKELGKCYRETFGVRD